MLYDMTVCENQKSMCKGMNEFVYAPILRVCQRVLLLGMRISRELTMVRHICSPTWLLRSGAASGFWGSSSMCLASCTV